MDSSNDAIDDYGVGGGHSEIYGMGYTVTDTDVIFAVNSNFALQGMNSHWAQDGHVAWGDLLLNFSGQNHDTASNNGLLYGIKFSPNNPSAMGLYSNVTAKTVAYENGLLLQDRSLRGYNNYVTSKGGNPSMGDLSSYDPYFSQDHHVQNAINSGTKIGDIEMVSDLGSLGLDFGHFGGVGSQTFGFKLSRELLPYGEFLAFLAEECDNDMSTIIGSIAAKPEPPVDVPEPSTAMGITLLGLLLMSRYLREKKHFQ
ncbi:PEP-CTERM sorting domain-containing protein [Planktothrix mougeotii LEGE 06226]|uniref:PEP-CTERM sorting domain-containing protein n=2 Tax=Planktothrix mougeotii TaxID=54306 RepID=A0ABR9UBN3_9CYAN|nr:PEP-CTERM sorting domain-containing protein [Planktothrix mougeotii LEGE 06226]